MEKELKRKIEIVNELMNKACDEKILVSYIDDKITMACIKGGRYLGIAKRNKKEDKFDRKVAILVSVARALRLEEKKIQLIIDILFNDEESIARKLKIETLSKVIDEKAAELLKERI